MPKERRRHVRAGLAATLTAWSGEVCRGSYVVENLSGGGVYVSGGPRVREGEQLRLLLQLPRELVAVSGVVVRCIAQARDYALAFHFESPSARAADAIARAVAEASDTAARDAAFRDEPTVLVVHEALFTREALARELRTLGRESACFATALDAIDYLDRCGQQLKLALVEASNTRGGADLLQLLADDWPAIRRVPISDAAGAARARASQEDAALLLKTPWNLSDLARVLDRHER